jgi:hypothetical protein
MYLRIGNEDYALAVHVARLYYIVVSLKSDIGICFLVQVLLHNSGIRKL